MDVTQLIEAAQKWAADDLDESSRAAMTTLIEARDDKALREAMLPPLAFGTAGLRGQVGPGPARMNPATIASVSWALGDYLCSLGDSPQVVVGFDARPESAGFASLCADVLAGCGVQVLLSKDVVPTPIIAYLVRSQHAAAGVVVTASHNPRGQNGFKVFDGDGVQIVAPWDEEIAARLGRAPAPSALKRTSSGVVPVPNEAIDAYFSDLEVTADDLVGELSAAERLKLTYSPIHGVGLEPARRAVASLDDVLELSAVDSQAQPDGTFPTAAFPNPEEKGVLDLLLEQAKDEGASAACAHDPDADRFSLCLPLGGSELVRLSGDALGLLFADACLSSTRARNPELISTIVSSPGATLLAERYGARMTRTLTGFKWLCHAALESDAFVFAYEEALGYCFSAPEGHEGAMDKDGLVALRVAARLLLKHGGGEGLAGKLLSIYKDIGLWGSFGHGRRFDGPGGSERLATQMDRLRESPDPRLGGLLVTKRVDYREGAEQRPWYLGAQDLVRFDLEPEGDHLEGIVSGRVFVRPSGTEPKLKAYVHLCSEFNDTREYQSKNQAQENLAKAIARQVLSRPESILPPPMTAD